MPTYLFVYGQILFSLHLFHVKFIQSLQIKSYERCAMIVDVVMKRNNKGQENLYFFVSKTYH
jgi:hypothetical protein